MSNESQPLMTELADAAFRQAAKKVIKLAKETGTPVIVWENGAIKRLEPTDDLLKKYPDQGESFK